MPRPLTTTMLLAALAAMGTLAGVSGTGCAQKRAQPSARSAAPAATAPSSEEDPSAAQLAEAAKEKKPRFGVSAVYIDGKPAGVIRAPELPTALKGRIVNLGGGYEATRYYFTDYARSLGIDPQKVKALHVYGGQRVVVVDQAEFRRIADKLSFSFVQGDRGKARIHWPPMKLNVNTTIDMLTNVVFYIEKEPPTLKDGELVMPDGKLVESKVPYAPEEQGNGTRVYVDGALVGTVKRKKLTNDLLAKDANENDETARFSLVAYAAKFKPEAKNAKVVDLVAGDDVVAHLAADKAKDLSFKVPAHNRGQALVDVPTDKGIVPARISAVQIFVNSAPKDRPVASIDSVSDAQPGAGGQGQGGQGGSASDDEL